MVAIVLLSPVECASACMPGLFTLRGGEGTCAATRHLNSNYYVDGITMGITDCRPAE